MGIDSIKSIIPDYTPKNPYLKRKYEREIKPEIERSLQESHQFDNADNIYAQIRQLQNMKKLELLNQRRQRQYHHRMKAISSARLARMSIQDMHATLPSVMTKKPTNSKSLRLTKASHKTI